MVFQDCTALTSINIPDSLQSSSGTSFYGCTAISSPLYNKSKTALWYVNKNMLQDGQFDIPDTTTSIKEYAFTECPDLKTITIPNTIVSIGGWAFDGCKQLQSVTIPDGITYIGSCAFQSCSALTTITYQGTVYTEKETLSTALSNNGVTVGNDIFNGTGLS